MKIRFNSLTPELIQKRQQTHELCRQFGRSPSKGNLKRLKQLFLHCGEHVIIESGFYCDYGDKISVGERTFININCTILDAGLVSIGSDCLFGPQVQIFAVSHDTDPTARTEKHNYAEDVTIHNNVWIGASSIILPGITIGENSVIGAGSVVTKDIEAGFMYAGNPAVKIKKV